MINLNEVAKDVCLAPDFVRQPSVFSVSRSFFKELISFALNRWAKEPAGYAANPRGGRLHREEVAKVIVLGDSLHMHHVADLPLSVSDVNEVRSRLFRPLACQSSLCIIGGHVSYFILHTSYILTGLQKSK